jgi:hypothetical protein
MNRTSSSMSPSQPTGESTQESQDHTNNTQKSQYDIDDEKQLIAQEPTPLQNFIIPGDSYTNRIIEQNSTNNNNSDDAVVDIPDSENDGTSNHPTPCAKPRHVERNDGDDLQRAIQLSRQAADDEARRRAQEEEELNEVLRLSIVESTNRSRPSSRSSNIQKNGHDVFELSDTEDDPRFESFGDFYDNLTREQFEQFFDNFFNRQGGIEKVEDGSLVKEGIL